MALAISFTTQTEVLHKTKCLLGIYIQQSVILSSVDKQSYIFINSILHLYTYIYILRLKYFFYSSHIVRARMYVALCRWSRLRRSKAGNSKDTCVYYFHWSHVPSSPSILTSRLHFIIICMHPFCWRLRHFFLCNCSCIVNVGLVTMFDLVLIGT